MTDSGSIYDSNRASRFGGSLVIDLRLGKEGEILSPLNIVEGIFTNSSSISKGKEVRIWIEK